MRENDLENKIIAQIDSEELIRLTADLVRINSVFDPEAGTSEQPAAECAAEWARAQGFDVEIDQVVPGRPNAIVTCSFGPGEKKLMFEGHTDVVTPGDLKTWTHDPFGAEIVGRRMFGRGTNDTKGNLAAMLIAMAALKRSGVPLKGSIVGGVLCDEEGQMLGVQDFIARGRADRVTAAVICEPQDDLICTSQKGAIRTRFTVTGKMSHGAMPLYGLNPAPALARIIDGLHDLERSAAEEHGRDPFLGWPSFTPTVIRSPGCGAPQLNVVPRDAEILVDIRTIPSQNHDAVRESLKRLAAGIEESVRKTYEDYDRRLGLDRDYRLQVQAEFLTDRPCTKTEHYEAVVVAADRAFAMITGQTPKYGGVPGATDGTFLWALNNIPIVTIGAGDRWVPHQADEWVDLDQLTDMARIYALTAYYYLQ